MKLVLLHSPLVGPGTWRLLAPALEARGYDVVVPDCGAAMRGAGPYYPALVRAAVAGLDAAETVVFVAHSGAGALIPAVSEGRNACAVFVDALLPYPGRCWFDSASEQLNIRIRDLAQGGLVPPWHRWWPKGAIQGLLGSHYESFAEELAPTPLAFFSEIAPAVAALPACAYLQLSDACAADADEAQTRGWPTRRMTLNHLAVLTHYGAVGAAVDDLVRTIRPG